MNLAFVKTRSALGIDAKPVSVEVHLANGLPAFAIVGLPETAVKESKDRVFSAIVNSHFDFPYKRITVNLAPADLPKNGSGLDLPIAIGILAASKQIPSTQLDNHEFIGELALSGNLRGVSAILPIVLATSQDNHTLIIAESNAQEAALTGYQQIYSAQNLRAVCAYLSQGVPLQNLPKVPDQLIADDSMDWSDIKGQFHAKFALEIAACGGHSVLLSGTPGSGKTMLAKRVATLLPALTEQEALECAAIHSIRKKIPNWHTWKVPPFRSPHHTSSPIALVGGGSPPKPGEISLAHHGVLFLDELPEFNKQVLETLREPLESGSICISRASMQVEFPANFQLIAAMNPCPCGNWGNPQAGCICAPERIHRYISKISAPLLDRIDMQINVLPLSRDELLKPNPNPPHQSEKIREQVITIRAIQMQRQGCLNARLSPKNCEMICAFDTAGQEFLQVAMEKLKFSARAYHRLLKVSRTLADYKRSEQVKVEHLQQALSFRQNIKVI